MTVSTTVNRINHIGNGVTTVFAFPYKFIQTADLLVYVAGVLLLSGYTVGAPTDSGANVTFSVAPANGSSIVLVSSPSQLQSTALPSTGPFPAKSVETALDKLTLLVQRASDLIGRSFRLSDSDTTTASTILPSPSSNSLIGWNQDANALQNVDPTTLATIVAFGTANADVFTGTGAQTVFTLSANPGAQANLDVAVGGVTQLPNTDYTWAGGTSITFAVAPPNLEKILVRYFQGLPQGVSDSAASTFVPEGAGSVTSTTQEKLRRYVDAFDCFTAAQQVAVTNRTGVTDVTAPLLLALAKAIGSLPATLRLPAGVYSYTSLGNLAATGLTIEGAGSDKTVLRCTAAGYAIDIDGWAGGVFVQGLNLSGLTVEGNAGTTAIIRARKLARCQWSDVNVREADTVAGIGVLLQGVMLSRFDSLMCSQDRQAMVSAPYEGLRLESTLDGNSSLNVFNSTYMEGAGAAGTNTIEIGIRLSGADQTTFLGGSPESCKAYGVLVSATSRYNTFIGVGFENLDATADIGDGGISTKYINCYSSQKVLLQGRGCEVLGGYFERIQVDAGAVKNRVINVTVNNWATGAGGFVDNGTATEWKNIYDADLAAYVYPLQDRAGITVGASPYRYTNSTGMYQEVIIQAGTVSQILQYRRTDNWQKPIGTYTCHLLAPGDQLDVSYSAIPSMSYVPHNGFQG